MLNSKHLFRCLLVLPSILLSSCSNEGRQISKNYTGFDTLINIKYFGEIKNENEDVFAKIINEYDTAFDAHSESGTIYQINENPYVEMPYGSTKELLEISSRYKDETNNVFNPFLKEVIDLWKSSLEEDVIPDSSLVNSLNNDALSTSLIMNENSVILFGDGKIDLGGIAKGYLLSKIKPIFIENKISDYIVDAGSSSILLGESSLNHESGTYNVGIYKSNESAPSRFLKLKNTAIGTSSIYEQKYLTIGGKTYSHCINGKTGSAEVKNDMVVVLGDDPIMCDVYSTVGMVSSIDEIKQIEKEKPIKFLVFSNDEITYQNPDIKVYTR